MSAITQTGGVTNQLIRVDEVMRITGIRAKSTLYLWMKNGTFPKSRKMSTKARAWLVSDVTSWIATREAA